MPGLLDLLGYSDGIPPLIPPTSFPGRNASFDAPVQTMSPAEEAQAAREAAALRLRLGQRGANNGTVLQGGPVPFDFGSAGIPMPPAAPATIAPTTPASALAAGDGLMDPSSRFGSIAPTLSGGVADPYSPKMPTVSIKSGTTTPPASAPTIGRGDGVTDGVQAAPPPLPGPKLDGSVPPSLFSRVGSFLSNNSDALIGVGAGLASGRGWAPGISRGLTAGSAGAESDTARANQNKTANFLQQRLGVSAEEANAIATNPALLKHNLDYMYAKPVQVKVTDRRGNESTDLVNPFTGQSVIQRGPVRVKSFEEAAGLKPGTPFIDPKGQLRMR